MFDFAQKNVILGVTGVTGVTTCCLKRLNAGYKNVGVTKTT